MFVIEQLETAIIRFFGLLPEGNAKDLTCQYCKKAIERKKDVMMVMKTGPRGGHLTPTNLFHESCYQEATKDYPGALMVVSMPKLEKLNQIAPIVQLFLCIFYVALFGGIASSLVNKKMFDVTGLIIFVAFLGVITLYVKVAKRNNRLLIENISKLKQ